MPVLSAQQIDPQQQASLLEHVKDTQGSMVKLVQGRRRMVEERWMAKLDCYNTKHRDQGFKGEWFNHYLPAARRSLERFTIRCKQMLFPSPDFFEVYPTIDGAHELGSQAESWKVYMQWLFAQRIKMRSVVTQALRCYGIYERAVVKTYLEMGPDGLLWPTVRAVDPFNFYVWPETETELYRAQMVFEHTMMPYEHYATLAGMGVVDEIRRDELTTPEWPQHMTHRLSQQGISNLIDGSAGGRDLTTLRANEMGIVSITEMWFKQRETWVQALIVWNVDRGPRVVRLNFQFPQNPYRMAVARELPGSLYGSSMMDDLRALNVVLNDQVNMTLEGTATALFPPTAVDPTGVARNEHLVHRPRAKWMVPPNSIKVLEGQSNPTAGYQGIQMVMGLLDSYSGSNPLAEGTPTRGMPRAGFAVSSLIGLSMSDIRDTAEVIEDSILTPVLADVARFTRLLPPQQIIKIPGTEAMAQGILRVQDLNAGDYMFRWVGTLQAQDMQVRAQRMLSLLGTLAKVYPSMIQQGWDIDFGVLGKKLWRDGMGERGADSIIIPRTPPPPPPPPPPKVSIALSGQLMPVLAQQLAGTAPGIQSPQPPPGGQGGPPQPGPGRGTPGGTNPGSGGPTAPAPASPEQGQAQDTRAMAESGAGKLLSGLGTG